MTNLSERPNTALLVIDVQNNVVAKSPSTRRSGCEHSRTGREGAR